MTNPAFDTYYDSPELAQMRHISGRVFRVAFHADVDNGTGRLIYLMDRLSEHMPAHVEDEGKLLREYDLDDPVITDWTDCYYTHFDELIDAAEEAVLALIHEQEGDTWTYEGHIEYMDYLRSNPRPGLLARPRLG